MELENLTDSLSKAYNTTKEAAKQNKDYLTAASISIAIKVSDTLLTRTLAFNYGVKGEGNPFLRHSMEKLGVEAGLLIPTVILLAAILGVAYYGNKKFPEMKPGNKALYCVSGLWGLGSLNGLLLAYVLR